MKKICLLFLAYCTANPVFACTTFCISKNGQLVFGRNYDWITAAGIVHTNQRGLLKTSMRSGDAATISWVSKYGSVTFNQYGKEFPTGGMNEKGLVVELMWLDGTRYPEADQRPAVGVLQWIQYQLDNAATTAELIASDGKLRISKRATPLHYLVADAGGNVATIEFLDGKMIVHKDKDLPFPVLTNDTYASSAKIAKAVLHGGATAPTGNSLERFVQACSMVKKFRETDINMPVTDYAFSILDKVAQGIYTKWSIVYDISNRKIHFKTEAHTNIKSFGFTAFDFACAKPAKMFNMNQQAAGDISARFTLGDKKLKERILQQAVRESNSRVEIGKKEEEELLHFEDGVSCRL